MVERAEQKDRGAPIRKSLFEARAGIEGESISSIDPRRPRRWIVRDPLDAQARMPRILLQKGEGLCRTALNTGFLASLSASDRNLRDRIRVGMIHGLPHPGWHVGDRAFTRLRKLLKANFRKSDLPKDRDGMESVRHSCIGASPPVKSPDHFTKGPIFFSVAPITWSIL